MKITVGMPVQGYLAKYFFWKENLDPKKIIELKDSTPMLMTLNGLLTGKLKLENGPIEDFSLNKYDAEILCQVSASKERRGLMFFSIDSIRWFDTYLYRCFHDDLLYRILFHKEFKIDEKKTIEAYMMALDIEDQVKFESVKKANYRLRKSRNLPVFRIEERLCQPNHYFTKLSA